MKKTQTHRGGKREGAGRPALGKGHFNVTLTAANVKEAKSKERNFSGLLDTLLVRWLRTKG